MTTYISNSSGKLTSASKGKRSLTPFVSLIMAFAVLLMGGGIAGATLSAKAADPIEYFFCYFEGDENEAVSLMYEVAFTDVFPYTFMSKSTVNAGTEDAISGNLLTFNKDFQETNEIILGRSLDPAVERDLPFNGGERVNPYDRFGLAGLSWSSYSGEWNYQRIDVCDGRVINMQLGKFYEERLPPKSTFANAGNSTDIRSKLVPTKNIVVAYDWVNILANGIFNMTKAVTGLTIALIGLSFTDLTALIGLDALISEPGGLFNTLYSYIYLPLILLVMLIMAAWAAWNGIVKRAYRRTLGGIAQSIAMFLAAGIIAAQPAFWMALPNNAAIILQSVLINSLGSGLSTGDGICAVGGVYTVDRDGRPVPAPAGTVVDVNPNGPSDPTNAEEAEDLLTQASQSMQSVIGCQLWYTYAFRPWTLGQFGTEYHQLWANGFADTSIFADSKELGNDNEAMVGTAAVPLGGGYFLNNWALFHLSTQTNVHAPYGAEPGEENKPSIYTDGVANDWWRVVDAVANYNEKVVTNGVPASNECRTDTPIEGTGCATDADSTSVYRTADVADSSMPDTSKLPTPYWENWIGTEPLNRIWIAMGSLLPAIAGNLAPIVFAGLSAILGIAIAVAVAFAPVFLLIGAFPGNGFRIFKEWAQLLLNLVLRRILAGALLVFSLVLISIILAMMDNFVDWLTGIIIICILSFAVIKMRQQIMDKLGGLFSFSFAGGAFRDTSMDAMKKIYSRIDPVQNAGTAVAAWKGANAYDEAGKNPWKGVVAGAGADIKMRMYSGSELSRRTAMYIDKFKDDEDAVVDPKRDICVYCNLPIVQDGDNITEVRAARDRDGNWVCEDCARGAGPKGREPILNGGGGVETFRVATEEFREERKKIGFNKRDMSDDELASELEAFRSRPRALNTDLPVGSTSHVESALRDVIFVNEETGETSPDLGRILGQVFKQDVDNFEKTGVIPPVPQQLSSRLKGAAKDRVEILWRDGSVEAKETIAYVYANALVDYSYENGVQQGAFANKESSSKEDDVKALYGDLLIELSNGVRYR